MLVRALKRNVEGLRDAAKQLLIWSRNKTAEFSTYEDDFFPSSNRKNYPRREKYGRYNDDRSYDRGFSRKSSRRMKLKDDDISFNENLKPHVKDFYQPHPDVLNRSSEEINQFRRNHDIQIFGRNVKEFPPPILNFNEINLPEDVSNVISKLNYTNPTSVQSQTWPIALSGQNMVGISRTGSGKTLGFVLPALLHIKHQPPLESGEGPIALMIAPTRELGRQILEVVEPFARAMKYGVAALFGGSSRIEQVNRLQLRNEICVATPGRLNDVLNDNFMQLNRCTYFVLDEADRLLDMGFHPQIKSVFHYCRPDRQVLMWSATWPKEVKALAETFLRDYIAVKFGSEELAANPNIKQIVHVCDEREKFGLLKNLLQKINETEENKTLIFTQTKLKAQHIAIMLQREGYKVASIHGDKSQLQRDRALREFRKGFVKILVGTQVVGRGIDINDIGHVIIFDFPTDMETYVHSIGRTARNNNSGTSHVFVTDEDANSAKDLIKILNQANQPVNPELLDMVQSRKSDVVTRITGMNISGRFVREKCFIKGRSCQILPPEALLTLTALKQ